MPHLIHVAVAVVSLVVFVAMAGAFVMGEMVRGGKGLPEESNLNRVGCRPGAGC